MKSKAKCNDKQSEDKKELCKCFHDIRKHDDIDTKLWEFTHKQNEANPR